MLSPCQDKAGKVLNIGFIVDGQELHVSIN